MIKKLITMALAFAIMFMNAGAQTVQNENLITVNGETALKDGSVLIMTVTPDFVKNALGTSFDTFENEPDLYIEEAKNAVLNKLSTLSEDNGTDVFAYYDEVDITTENSKSIYSLTMDFSDYTTSGIYLILIKDNGNLKAEILDFVSAFDRTKAIDELLMTTSSTQREQIINSYSKELSSVGIEVEDLKTLSERDKIVEKSVSDINALTDGYTETKVKSIFNKYIGAELIRTSTAGKYPEIFDSYIQYFTLDLDSIKIYEELKANKKEGLVYSSLNVSEAVKSNDFQTALSLLSTAFDQSVKIAEFSTTTSRDETEKLLSDNSTMFGIDLSQLSGITPYNLQLFYSDFIGVSFNNLLELQNYYTQKVAYYKTQGAVTGGITGTVSGGTSGGSSSFSQSNSVPQKESATTGISFNDISGVLWAKESIEKLAQAGIVSGDGAGKFRPQDYITRAEFVKIFVGAFNLLNVSSTSDFSDVSKNAWYYKYISSASSLGLINGTGNNIFGPDYNITRQDVAVIIDRYLGKLPAIKASVQFSDSNEISSYAIDAVSNMQSAGIIEGDTYNNFNPLNNATRAEIAVIICRVLGITEGK